MASLDSVSRWCIAGAALLSLACAPELPPPLDSEDGAVVQPSDGDRIVVVEAEDYGEQLPGNGDHSWVIIEAPTASGGKAMRAEPESNTTYDSNYATQSPRLSWAIQFAVSGDQYLWIRGNAANSGANSLHVGLDGAKQTQFDWATPGTDWQWQQQSLSIPSAAAHEVMIWMREDGLAVDRLLITTNASYDPSAVRGGLGP